MKLKIGSVIPRKVIARNSYTVHVDFDEGSLEFKDFRRDDAQEMRLLQELLEILKDVSRAYAHENAPFADRLASNSALDLRLSSPEHSWPLVHELPHVEKRPLGFWVTYFDREGVQYRVELEED